MVESRAPDRIAPPHRLERGRPGLSGGTAAISFVVVAGLPLMIAVLTDVEPGGFVFELATSFGITATALIVLQFWSSGRYEVISGRIGIDRTMGFHRIAAYALVAFALLHPLIYVLETAIIDPVAAWQRLAGMVSSPRLSTGVLALSGLILLVAISIFRRALFQRYETWRLLHGPLAIVVGGLTMHHAITSGTYSQTLPVLAVWIVFIAAAGLAVALVYVYRPYRMTREGWHLERVTAVGEKTWQLELVGPPATRFRFRGGQFLWLTFAPHRPPLHDHPFSIASSPAELPKLRLIVREAGDCTNEFGTLEPGTRAAIDGPHGSFILPDGEGPVLLIAGGVGIAPVLGLLEEAASVGCRRPFTLLYAERSEGFLSGVERLSQLQLLLRLEVKCFVDHHEGQPRLVAGPIQAEHVRAALGNQPSDWTAFVCGPSGLTEKVTDALYQAGVEIQRIHYERFDYAAGAGHLDLRRQGQAYLVLAALLVACVAFALRALVSS